MVICRSYILTGVQFTIQAGILKFTVWSE